MLFAFATASTISAAKTGAILIAAGTGLQTIDRYIKDNR